MKQRWYYPYMALRQARGITITQVGWKLSAVAAGHTMQVKEKHYEKIGGF